MTFNISTGKRKQRLTPGGREKEHKSLAAIKATRKSALDLYEGAHFEMEKYEVCLLFQKSSRHIPYSLSLPLGDGLS